MARLTSDHASHRDSALTGVSPEALIVVSAISLYAGAAVAASLFDYLQPQSVAWIRVAGAALLLLAGAAAAHAAPRTANGFVLEPSEIPAQEILAGGPPRDRAEIRWGSHYGSLGLMRLTYE